MARTRPRQLKLSEVIARDIVEDISKRGLKRDEMLPGELVMLGQYQVGRNSLREALRLLETQGLVQIKSGPGGGPAVGHASAKYLGRTAALFFRMSGGTYQDVADAMLEFIPVLASLAAQNKGSKELKEKLRRSIDELSRKGQPEEAGAAELMDFHGIVRELCGNPVIALVIGAVEELFYEHVVRLVDTTTIHASVLIDHHKIADAIVEGRADDAYRLMFDHMNASVAFCRKQMPGIFSQPVVWH